ncbi:hypothetical protein OGAPHI_003919 [Ogataea philodendri]|uniref:Secreted protein n=1 Tax=Ogataea philodendri TaxID=1378263 RepID=A0A9P8T4H3_9ASCO|nr:uncharacterized protein OGAPHI_003919 [Ogataea philodendri]KAH3665731.1 hypothetical protein OGAPHI_003919 [Ogataea philodendri]
MFRPVFRAGRVRYLLDVFLVLVGIFFSDHSETNVPDSLARVQSDLKCQNHGKLDHSQQIERANKGACHGENSARGVHGQKQEIYPHNPSVAVEQLPVRRKQAERKKNGCDYSKHRGGPPDTVAVEMFERNAESELHCQRYAQIENTVENDPFQGDVVRRIVHAL